MLRFFYFNFENKNIHLIRSQKADVDSFHSNPLRNKAHACN